MGHCNPSFVAGLDLTFANQCQFPILFSILQLYGSDYAYKRCEYPDTADTFKLFITNFTLNGYVPDQVRTLSQVGTSSYMAYAM